MNAARVVKEQTAELMQRQELARTAAIARDDLYLLMEVYNNMVESNTTILDRQEVLHVNSEKTLAELVNMCGNQARLLEEIRNTHKAAMTAHQLTVSTLKDLDHDILKAHHQLNLRIYVALVGMGVIILTLLGMLAKVM